MSIELTEGSDFIFVPHPTLEDHSSVKLLSGIYAGVVYTYGNIALSETDDGFLKISFVFKMNTDLSAPVEHDPAFKNYIGDVLNAILANPESKIGKV